MANQFVKLKGNNFMKKNFLFNLSEKYPFFKKFYFFYNIYIRNRKYINKGTQFGEDSLISEFINKKEKGNFVDVGCFHPTKHNNTYALYKRNWKGINIDLNPLTIELFNFFRPRDININTAVSDTEDEKDLFFLGKLNTQNTIEKNHLYFLNNHQNVRDENIEKLRIKTKRLDKILSENNFKEIDFINIDVEGHELSVLKSIDFDKVKIALICIEILEHNNKSLENNEKIKDFLKIKNFKLEKKIGVNYIYKKND